MPVDSAELANSLRQAKKKQMFFVFVAKGTDGALHVNRTKIPAKVASEAKKECGGGVIYKGNCLYENDTLVFEVAKEPPATLAAQIKKIITRDAALTFKVLVRANRVLEEEAGAGPADQEGADEASPEAPATPGAQPLAEKADQTKFTERLRALKPRYVEVLHTNPPNKTVLEQAMTLAVSSAKEAQFARGLTVLARLEEALQRSPSVPPTPPRDEKATTTGQRVAAVPIWRDAREEVGAQLSKLQSKLRQTGDPQFVRIAELGLNGITKRLQVGLQVALMEVDRAAGAARAQAAAKAQALVGEYSTFIKTDPAVALLDKNPFGILVSIRTTLGKALDSLDQALRA